MKQIHVDHRPPFNRQKKIENHQQIDRSSFEVSFSHIVFIDEDDDDGHILPKWFFSMNEDFRSNKKIINDGQRWWWWTHSYLDIIIYIHFLLNFKLKLVFQSIDRWNEMIVGTIENKLAMKLAIRIAKKKNQKK